MYEKFYGFSALPFRLSPDPSFFFGSKGHRRALAYLRYGLTQKEGFIVVTGSPGTGKTTLARALLGEVSKEKIIVGELNNTHLQADDVLRMAAASFGLEHENLPKASLLKRLESFFMSKYRSGYHCLLLIDEAQNLPFESLEELRMLSNFYQGKHALLQIFLMGQQQFRDLLYSPDLEQLRQRVVAATHLDPLDAQESREYIIHRLKQVGWKGANPAFSKRAFAHIYSLTKGIPRRINTFCDRLMLYASLEELKEIHDATVRAVARELMFEISHRSQVASQPQDEVLKDVNDVDSELDSSAESDEEMISPDDAREDSIDDLADELPPPVSAAKTSTISQPVVSKPVTTPPMDAVASMAKQPVDRGSARVVAQDQTALAAKIEVDPESQIAVQVSDQEWTAAMALVFDWSRDATKQSEWLSSSTRLPRGTMGIIQCALGKWSPSASVLQQQFKAANADELKIAARSFIKTVWLANTADYYRRLGLDRQANDEAIRTHYRLLFRLFQPDLKSNTEAWDKTSAQRINQAYTVLRDSGKRLAYDQFLDNLQTGSVTAMQPRIDINVAASRNDSMPTQIGDVFLEQDVFAQTEIAISDQTATREAVQPVEAKGKNNKKMALVLGGTALAVVGIVAGWVWQNGLPTSAIVPEETDTVDFRAPVENTEPNITSAPSEFAPAVSESIPTSPKESIVKNEPTSSEINVAADTLDKPAKKAKTVKEEPKPIAENVGTPGDMPKRDEVSVASVETPKPTVEKIEDAPRARATEPIQQADLKALINKFALAYEEADTDTLMSLFSSDAVTNDSQSKAEIRKDYVKLFKSSDMRVIDITNLRWKINQGKALGTGDFKVTVLRKGGKDMRSFVGSIQFVVEKGSNNLQIKEIYHAYSMDERS